MNDDNYYIALDFEHDEQIKNLKLYQYLMDRNNNRLYERPNLNHFNNLKNGQEPTDFFKLDGIE